MNTTDTKTNGWSNPETWAFNLMADNAQSTKTEVRDLIDRETSETIAAQELREWAFNRLDQENERKPPFLHDSAPFTYALASEAFNRINWLEIVRFERNEKRLQEKSR